MRQTIAGGPTRCAATVRAMAKRDVREKPRGEVRELWLDLGLVGGGLILGAVANIWRLFL